jgi:hypothetical protein
VSVWKLLARIAAVLIENKDKLKGPGRDGGK